MYLDSNGICWYKGNLHTHTRESDGAMTVDECNALYKSRGYDFLARTDHWNLSENGISKEGLLLLSGCEYNVGKNVVEGIFHIVGVGFDSDPGVERTDDPLTIMNKIHAAGGLVDMAHPAWSLNTHDQLAPFDGCVDYTEIYNSTSDYPYNCRPYSGDAVDILAARGIIWKLAAVDDVHWCRGDQCRSFVYVKAEELTHKAILDALRKGDFYASQGPHMDVTREGDKVTVVCPRADNINMITQVTDSAWENRRSYVGQNLEKVEFEFSPAASFMRIEIRDNENKWAWGQIIKK